MNAFMLVATAVISMSCGALVYRIGLFWVLGEDLRVRYLLWPSYLVFGIAVIVLYLPLFWWLRERWKATPALGFALVGALLGIAPTYGLWASGDSRLAHETFTEVGLIYGMFGVAGFAFGLCYAALSRDE